MSKQNKPSGMSKQSYQLSPSSNHSPELYHFGVKGMRWGVRRERGPDGTVGSTQASNKELSDYEKAREISARAKRSGTKSLTNQEMQMLVNRINLEQQYSNLTTIQKQKGNRFIDKVGNQMKKTAANEVSKQLMNAGKIILGVGIAYAANRARGNGQSYSFDFARRQIGR